MTAPASLSTEELAQLAPNERASLSEVQEWMALLLRHRKGLAKSEAMRRASQIHFSGNDRLSPAEQIDIYRQQFWLRHTSSLIEDFPGVTGLLGQQAWEGVVESYLSERGYDIFALKDLGCRFPAHLAGLDSLPDREILVDMARLEWAYAEAFHVQDDPVLSSDKLAAIPPDAWPGARIVLSHSLRLLQVQYPVARLRREIRQSAGGCPPRAAVAQEPQNLVVYRRDQTLWDKPISLPAFLLLAEFQKGTPLIPACEAVASCEPSAAAVFDEQLMDWFGLWGRLGWITDVATD